MRFLRWAPARELTLTFTPVGFDRLFERALLPSIERVLEAARKVLAY